MRLEGVRKSFGDNLVLDGIDVTVAPGEVLTIIGPSGSGKSTLLRPSTCSSLSTAAGFSSRARRSRARVNRNAIRQRIGIVFQQFNLFPHLKVIDNLPSRPGASGTCRARRRAKGAELL